MRTILLISYCIFATALSAQTKFNTGDADLDNDLTAINTSAKQDLNAFTQDLVTNYSVPSKTIDYMNSIKMEPADMFFAAQLSKTTGKNIDEVVDTYEKNRDKGWGYIAQEMGIKPGSPEFHALKDQSKAHKEKVSKANGNGNGNSTGKTTGNEKTKTKTKGKKS